MRKNKAFRPVVGDRLEDRTVPSGFGFGGFGEHGEFGGAGGPGALIGGPLGLMGGFGGEFGEFGGRFGGLGGFGANRIVSVPAQDAQQVAQAFQAFQQSYANDVNTILLATTGTPASNRAAFDAQVATDLATLNTAIGTAIKNLPDAATLGTTIQNELLNPTTGTAPATTLQSELAAVPTPTATGGWSAWGFLRQSFRAVRQSEGQVVGQVRSANPPAGTITTTTARTLIAAVSTAFQTFTQGYANAVTTTPPSASRTAFDTAVSGLVSTLNTSVGAALTAANLPAVTTGPLSTLAATLTADIQTPATGATGASLQEKLAALTTPAASTGWAEWVFQHASTRTIRAGQSQVIHDIVTAINAYNASL